MANWMFPILAAVAGFGGTMYVVSQKQERANPSNREKATVDDVLRWAEKPRAFLTKWDPITDLWHWQIRGWYNKRIDMSVTVHRGSVVPERNEYYAELEPGVTGAVGRGFFRLLPPSYKVRAKSEKQAMAVAGKMMKNPVAYMIEVGVPPERIAEYLSNRSYAWHR